MRVGRRRRRGCVTLWLGEGSEMLPSQPTLPLKPTTHLLSSHKKGWLIREGLRGQATCKIRRGTRRQRSRSAPFATWREAAMGLVSYSSSYSLPLSSQGGILALHLLHPRRCYFSGAWPWHPPAALDRIHGAWRLDCRCTPTSPDPSLNPGFSSASGKNQWRRMTRPSLVSSPFHWRLWSCVGVWVRKYKSTYMWVFQAYLEHLMCIVIHAMPFDIS
jgi:hypothetical protein